ncbi:MAG: hypothetical protein DRJ50_03655 [Actinobacteria bacterium]|nr:MAG: hypothetical protein DRJ50_03655 [Actinomycetota bacterium]
MKRPSGPHGIRITCAGLLLVVAACQTGSAPVAETLTPLTESSFDFTDPAAFRLVSEGDEPLLELLASAEYAPPYRSPHAIALLGGLEFRSFVLDAELQQTGREYGHRDLCLFFGFESAERFYYVHMATTPDQNAHNVFLVDQAARRNLLPPQSQGVEWGNGEWHHIRLARDVDAGLVQVYFDDMVTPVLEVEDVTIEWGRIGFGSFDDTGLFRNVVLTDYESRLGPHGI